MVSDARRLELLKLHFSQKVEDENRIYTVSNPSSEQILARTRLRLAVQSVCRLVPPGSRILDLGCGCGIAASILAELGYEVTALDLVPQMFEPTKERTDQSIEWLAEAFHNKIAPKGTFDVVLALGFLEYQERAGKELVKMRKLLKPGGLLLLSVPNTLGSQFHFGLKRAFFRAASEPEGTLIRHSFTPERLQRLLGMAGFIFLDYQWLPNGEGETYLDPNRDRDVWKHRVRWRCAPEFLTLSRSYKAGDTAATVPE